MRVLVVCVGNQCRSPLAERLLQARADATTPGLLTVTSAGTRARPGHPMDEQSARELERRGGDPDGFTSTRLTAELLAEHDLVLTATRDIRTDVLAVAPQLLKRAFTLTELAAILSAAAPPSLEALVGHAADQRSLGVAAPDVRDPIGRSDEVHRAVGDQIEIAVDRLVGAIARQG